MQSSAVVNMQSCRKNCKIKMKKEKKLNILFIWLTSECFTNIISCISVYTPLRFPFYGWDVADPTRSPHSSY